MSRLISKLWYGARVMLSRGGGAEETISVNGRPTVVRSGGDGPPFVYLHSTMGESFRWFPFYQTWATKFRVIVPTHPGFGHSGGFEQIDTIEDLVFHYLELLDALQIEEVYLGGVSLGGWIAAEFACRWPERVKKLWIADAPGMWVAEKPLPDLFRIMSDREAVRRLLFHDPNHHVAQVMFDSKPTDEQILTAYQNMSVLARLVWERPYNPKLPARLHRVRCPTLLVWGDDDRLVPPQYGESYRKYLPNAELKLIPNCGHLPMFEAEAAFVDLVRKFCTA